jgi:hypothetical protein
MCRLTSTVNLLKATELLARQSSWLSSLSIVLHALVEEISSLVLGLLLLIFLIVTFCWPLLLILGALLLVHFSSKPSVDSDSPASSPHAPASNDPLETLISLLLVVLCLVLLLYYGLLELYRYLLKRWLTQS